jgi:hypothetical protein
MALDALDNAARRARRQANRPESVPARPVDPNRPKIGASWSQEEEQQLRDEFAAHKPFRDIATTHGRTVGAITARLVKLGLIEDTATNRAGQGSRPFGFLSHPFSSPSVASAKACPHHPTQSGSLSPTMPADLSQEVKDNLPL